jgi:SAM-dependent methyltransferase
MPLDDTQRAALEQFGKQSHRYGKGHILENVEDVAQAVEKMDLPEHAEVLDVACGAGHTGLYLAGLGHSVTLADIAQPMLDRASELAVERGLVVKTHRHTAEALPYPDTSFDLVTCRVAAHHFSSPQDFVREAARVLKTGGYFLVIDGSVADDQLEAEEWLHWVEKYRDPSHGGFLTPRRWSELCSAAGLEVLSGILIPLKQPDLNWYFETAATSPENRVKVMDLIHNAPTQARQLFKLGEEEGKVVWWWQRITLVARKG